MFSYFISCLVSFTCCTCSGGNECVSPPRGTHVVASNATQAVREEKWLADCERDALKRDLEHATRRCAQMWQETRQLDAGVYDNNAVAVDGECNERKEVGVRIDATVILLIVLYCRPCNNNIK